MPAPTGDRAVTPVGWPQGYDATYYSSPWYLDWATYYSWLSVYPWHHAYWPYLVYYLWANPYPIQYWWQYPWYAASWWGYPWWSYWFSPWSYTYWAYWYSPGYPFHNPYRIQFTSTSAPNRPRSADSLFSEGLQRYWNRDFAGACPLLTAAIQQRPDDARLWYFKALAERQLGDAHAPESARRGAALEFLNASDARELSLALERVQGVDRQFLRAAWTVDLTVEKAQAIARMPVQPRSVVVRKK